MQNKITQTNDYIILDESISIDGADLGTFVWIIDMDENFANIKFGNSETTYQINIFDNDITQGIKNLDNRDINDE